MEELSKKGRTNRRMKGRGGRKERRKERLVEVRTD